LHGLEEETSQIIALKEILCIKDTAGDIAWVDAGEGVKRAGVAAELYTLWVLCC
jgi:hypothetical protein